LITRDLERKRAVHVAGEHPRADMNLDEGRTMPGRTLSEWVKDVTIVCAHTIHDGASASAQWLQLMLAEDNGDDNLVEKYIDAEHGWGVFAAREIAEGEQIWTEAPLVTVQSRFDFPRGMTVSEVSRLGKLKLAESIANALTNASASARADFYQLSCAGCHRNEHQDVGIFLTNGLTTHGKGSIFKKVSRFNHSCDPNMLHCWSEEHNQMTLFATRDIEEGTELTISYISENLQVRQRRSLLSQNYGFACECELCRAGES
jgi:hypothetical protein